MSLVVYVSLSGTRVEHIVQTTYLDGQEVWTLLGTGDMYTLRRRIEWYFLAACMCGGVLSEQKVYCV